MRVEIDAFRDAIRAAGMTPPDAIERRFHRFPGAGKGKGNTAGWCRLFADGMGGAFGDYSRDLTETWQARRDRPMTLQEREGWHEHVERAKAEAEAKRREDQAAAAKRAVALWEQATPAGEHQYLAAKAVAAHGVRIADGTLLVPMRDASGALVNVQRIAGDGAKRFLSGGRVTGCYHSIGKPNGGICIAEGYATGVAVHEATGHAVAVAFNAGNLEPVARVLRAKYSDATLILCADDDAATEGNPGLTKATEAARAVGGYVALPDFGAARPEGATDFNDLARHSGPDAVKQAVERAHAPDVSQHQPGAGSALPLDPAGVEWPEPLPIRNELHPVPPFDAAALLPDVLREWVTDEAERMPCPPDFIAAAAIVSLGSTIGARCAIKPKARDSWLVVPNLWGGIVGLPSAKKSPAIEAAMRPQYRLAAKAQEAYRADVEAFESARLIADARRDEIQERLKKAARKGGGDPKAIAVELR